MICFRKANIPPEDYYSDIEEPMFPKRDFILLAFLLAMALIIIYWNAK